MPPSTRWPEQTTSQAPRAGMSLGHLDSLYAQGESIAGSKRDRGQLVRLEQNAPVTPNELERTPTYPGNASVSVWPMMAPVRFSPTQRSSVFASTAPVSATAAAWPA